ncbi:MAG: hypothetical protein ACYSWO_29385 [Planctomycetota bacterium]|jgi:hypothetical protein
MLDYIEREGDLVLWRYKGLDGTSQLIKGEFAMIRDTELCDPGLLLTTTLQSQIRNEIDLWLEKSGEGPRWMDSQSALKKSGILAIHEGKNGLAFVEEIETTPEQAEALKKAMGG